MSFNDKETKQLLINIAAGHLDSTDYPLTETQSVALASDVYMEKRIPYIETVADGIALVGNTQYDIVSHHNANRISLYDTISSSNHVFYASLVPANPNMRVKNWVSPLDAFKDNLPCNAYTVRVWSNKLFPGLVTTAVDGVFEIPSSWMSTSDTDGSVTPGWVFNYQQGILMFSDAVTIPDDVDLFLTGFRIGSKNLKEHLTSKGFQNYVTDNTNTTQYTVVSKGDYWIAAQDIVGILGIDLNKGDRIEAIKDSSVLHNFSESQYWAVTRGGRAAEVATETTVGVIKPSTQMAVAADGTLTIKNGTDTTVGVVKGGENVEILVDGSLHAKPATIAITGAIKPKDGLSVEIDGSLNVKAATDTTIGGIKSGANVAVDANAVLTVKDATIVVPGAVKIDTAGGVPILDATEKLDQKYFPPLDTVERLTVANEAERLALLKGNKFRIVIQLDNEIQYYINAKLDPAVPTNWTSGGSVATNVKTFKTRTGDVVPTAGDYTAEMVNAVERPANADDKRRVVIGQSLQEELAIGTVLDPDFVYAANQTLNGLAGKEIGDNIKDLREVKLNKPLNVDGITYVMKDQQFVGIKTLTVDDHNLVPLNAEKKIDSVYLPDSMGGGTVLEWNGTTKYKKGEMAILRPQMFQFVQSPPWAGVYICNKNQEFTSLWPEVLDWDAFTPPGAYVDNTWNPNMTYKQGDIVIYNDNVYFARLGGNDTPSDMIVWTKITRPYKADAYDINKGYTIGGVVTQSGCLAYANSIIPKGTAFKWGTETGVGVYTWAPILNSGEFAMTFKGRCDAAVQAWVKGDTFSLGDSGAIYACYKDAPFGWNGSVTPPKTHFLNVAGGVPIFQPDGKVVVPTWALSGAYSAGEAVIYNDGKVYLANNSIPANTAFSLGSTGATWRLLNAPIEDYVINKAYNALSMVRYTDGDVYMSNAVIPVNTAWAIGETGATWRSMGGGKLSDYVGTKSYPAMSLVRYTDGELYYSNSAIPANTAWAVGETGATWRKVTTSGAQGNIAYANATIGNNTTLGTVQPLTSASSNGMTISGGGFDLKAGKTYMLSATIFGTGTGYAAFQWSTTSTTNTTDNMLGNRFAAVCANYTSSDTSAPCQTLIYSPSTNQTVYLKRREGAGVNIHNLYSWASVLQLSGTNGNMQVFEGCTATEPGKPGALSAVAAGNQDYILFGSGEWKPLTAAAANSTIVRGVTPGPTAGLGANQIYVDKQCRINVGGILSKVNFMNYNQAAAILVLRPAGGESSFNAGNQWTIKYVYPIVAGNTSIQPGYPVEVGDYIGIWVSVGITAIYNASGVGSNLMWAASSVSTMPSANTTFNSGSGNGYALASFGFEITTTSSGLQPQYVSPKIAVGVYKNTVQSTAWNGEFSTTFDNIGIVLTASDTEVSLPPGTYMVESQVSMYNNSNFFSYQVMTNVTNTTIASSTTSRAFTATSTSWQYTDSPISMSVIKNTNAGNLKFKMSISAQGVSSGNVVFDIGSSWWKITKLA